ncbi:hypothetical protein WUBG_12466 [Wuchereria bancrofti]|uniref:Uncharacterized protein n=1 Tax=Wuchereria bancrofti TaxID=6293 RepID=J9E316_WUCBA|nr:hypothetical protein WUBG_12466 [Wuchereria bancrofti]
MANDGAGEGNGATPSSSPRARKNPVDRRTTPATADETAHHRHSSSKQRAHSSATDTHPSGPPHL